MQWTIKDIIESTSGNLVNSGARFWRLSGVSTDSRTISTGELFIPLVGEKFDGHQFISRALDRGAAGIVLEEEHVDLPLLISLIGPIPIIAVKNTLRALGDLASFHINRCKNEGNGLSICGITGSNGKTTTKELIRALLAIRGSTHATFGNYNNHIGLPLTMLGTPRDSRYLVVEMGANHFGEISQLAAMVKPDVRVITCIAEAHLEGFGDLEGVARAKGELFETEDSFRGVVSGDVLKRYYSELSEKISLTTFGIKDDSFVSCTCWRLKEHGGIP